MAILSRCLIAVVLWSFLFSAPFARADVRVKLDLVHVVVDVSPVVRTHRTPISTGFVLSGQNEMRFGNGSGSRLGMTQRDVNEVGQQYNLGTRVRAGAIVFRKDYEKYYAVTTIRTDGKSSCQASVDYHRKPGQKYFTYVADNGATHNATEFYAENVRCTISE